MLYLGWKGMIDMRCDYCESSFNVEKFKYKGKTSSGKQKQATFKLCLDCQCYGVASSQNKIYELWDEEVIEDSIVNTDGSEMFAY